MLDALVVQDEHHVIHCSPGVILVCLYAITRAEAGRWFAVESLPVGYPVNSDNMV